MPSIFGVLATRATRFQDLSPSRARSGLPRFQAVAIACGLIWLIASGKLSSLKGDWAANQLFLAGGFAIMCLSMIIMKTHAVLSEQQRAR